MKTEQEIKEEMIRIVHRQNAANTLLGDESPQTSAYTLGYINALSYVLEESKEGAEE